MVDWQSGDVAVTLYDQYPGTAQFWRNGRVRIYTPDGTIRGELTAPAPRTGEDPDFTAVLRFKDRKIIGTNTQGAGYGSTYTFIKFSKEGDPETIDVNAVADFTTNGLALDGQGRIYRGLGLIPPGGLLSRIRRYTSTYEIDRDFDYNAFGPNIYGSGFRPAAVAVNQAATMLYFCEANWIAMGDVGVDAPFKINRMELDSGTILPPLDLTGAVAASGFNTIDGTLSSMIMDRQDRLIFVIQDDDLPTDEDMYILVTDENGTYITSHLMVHSAFEPINDFIGDTALSLDESYLWTMGDSVMEAFDLTTGARLFAFPVTIPNVSIGSPTFDVMFGVVVVDLSTGRRHGVPFATVVGAT